MKNLLIALLFISCSPSLEVVDPKEFEMETQTFNVFKVEKVNDSTISILVKGWEYDYFIIENGKGGTNQVYYSGEEIKNTYTDERFKNLEFLNVWLKKNGVTCIGWSIDMRE